MPQVGAIRQRQCAGDDMRQAEQQRLDHQHGPGATARFYRPRNIATDGDFVYVADYGNNAYRSVELGNGFVRTVFGVGADDFSNEGASAAGTVSELMADEATAKRGGHDGDCRQID